MTVRATIKRLDQEPDPSTLSGSPETFVFSVRMIVGPEDSPGEESFDLTVCSPEWLAGRSREIGLVDARHHLVVNLEGFDQRTLRDFLEQRVRAASGDTWQQVAEKISRLGFWEFEDYS